MEALTPEFLSRLHPLSTLGAASLGEILPLCHQHVFARHTDPFRATDWHDQLVYLAHGQIKLDPAAGPSRVLVGACDQGCFPIYRNNLGPVASRAITDLVLLSIREDPLDVLLTWQQLTAGRHSGPSLATSTSSWPAISGLLTVDNLVDGLFSTLPPAHVPQLMERFQRLSLPRGETLQREGETDDGFYLIESGRCKVSRIIGGSEVTLAILKAGDSFGEDALLGDPRRNATVTMTSHGVLLRLAKADFTPLMRAPQQPALSMPEARSRIAGGARWIDVRFPAEYKYDGLAGAINLPLDNLGQASATLDPATDHIVYCQTGRRSSAAAFLLTQAGFRAAYLAGGMNMYPGFKESSA